VRDWFLGITPPIPEPAGWAALAALDRLWPEYAAGLLNSRQRGSAVFVPLIDDGLTIAACEGLAGFTEVFTRWKGGGHGAPSELRFAAALVRAGYSPILQPRLESNVLHAVISLAGQSVYFEVAAPEYSDAVQQAFASMRTLSSKLADENPGVIVSIHLLTDPLPEVWDEVCDYVRTLAPSATTTAEILQDVAHLRTAVGGEPLPPPQLQGEALQSPLICSATARLTHGVWERADVYLPITDERAETLLHRELGHFSRHTTNVLALDISQVIGGMKSWVPLLKRRFQPNMNRRCGAVVLLENSVSAVDAAMDLHTLVLGNEHACRPVPPLLLQQLRCLRNLWRS
jgi:hypothetical protein